MNQSVLNITMDEELKRRFDAFCFNAGMSASVAVNLFARAVVREERIPFDIVGTADPFYSKENVAWIRQSIEQLDASQGFERKLIEAGDEDEAPAPRLLEQADKRQRPSGVPHCERMHRNRSLQASLYGSGRRIGTRQLNPVGFTGAPDHKAYPETVPGGSG